ncbi:hypothetical protein EZV62_027855 [Acer yangbiense]|uniref:Integrase catalytic domain-containing protein n=1 Tax=Acer yangbiense TaxID=1000413 RepID=A0A5C7GQW5_9ROSI|nr:hypothetical protein EZV62_027855 [Acer yangbiense]
MHQLPYPNSTSVTTKPLELVHTDLWGPAPMLSTEGYRYYISFVDSFSRFVWVFPLRFKSEAFNVFVQFHKMVELQFNTKLQCLQTDMGKEFLPILTYLKSLGVNYRLSCPYSHKQNGVAERKHRHLVETGLTLLAHAKMPLKFWVEAFQTAAILINNLPSPQLRFLSPFEILYRKKPNYHYFKSFGCACYPYLRPFQSQKFQFHSSKCVFLGYSLHHKGYKCLHSSGKIYLSQNVVFNELEFPFKSLFSSISGATPSSFYSLPTSVLHTVSPVCTNQAPIAASSRNVHQVASVQSTGSPEASHSSQASPEWRIASPTTENYTQQPTQPEAQPLNIHQSDQSRHPMVTRSKAGIFKPKTYSALCSSPFGLVAESEPRNVKAALSNFTLSFPNADLANC